MTDAERKELEEFTQWALVRTLTGQFPEPVFRELGFDDKDIKAIHPTGASARPAPRARTSASCSARTCTARCWATSRRSAC